MNHMNMNGLNVANGATGGMPMMSNGTNGVVSRTGSDQDRELDYKSRLNTYIYDYLLKQESYDCARALLKSGLTVQTTNKPSPGRRLNGIDEGSIDADSKDDIESQRPHDLPLPEFVDGTDSNSFLLEWFSLFWDMFFAARKDSKKTSHQAMQYVQHTQVSRTNLVISLYTTKKVLAAKSSAPRTTSAILAKSGHNGSEHDSLSEHAKDATSEWDANEFQRDAAKGPPKSP